MTERGDLERLSREDLIDLLLQLQRPEKTSLTSFKPLSTERKEQRERSKPGETKPGHDGHSRVMSEVLDHVHDHRPGFCPCCQAMLPYDLAAKTVSVHERIDLPKVRPVVAHHRRLAVRCPVFALSERVTSPEASTLAAKRRTLDRQLAAILATVSTCDLARALQGKISRARDKLLTFLDHPGAVEVCRSAWKFGSPAAAVPVSRHVTYANFPNEF